MILCPRCGKENRDSDAFCAFCGKKLSGEETAPAAPRPEPPAPPKPTVPVYWPQPEPEAEPIGEQPNAKPEEDPGGKNWPIQSVIMLAIASAAAVGAIIYILDKMNGTQSTGGANLLFIAMMLILAVVPFELIAVLTTKRRGAKLTAIPLIVEGCLFLAFLVAYATLDKGYDYARWDSTYAWLGELILLCVLYAMYVFREDRSIAIPVAYVAVGTVVSHFLLMSLLNNYYGYRLYSDEASRYYSKSTAENISFMMILFLFGFLTILFLFIGTAFNIWALYKDRNRIETLTAKGGIQNKY